MVFDHGPRAHFDHLAHSVCFAEENVTFVAFVTFEPPLFFVYHPLNL
jgi:hypothetical protein